MVAVDNRVAHMGKHGWNTGSGTEGGEEPYLLQKSLAVRFIEYDNDPTSGPLLRKRRQPQVAPDTDSQAGAGRYTVEGLSGAWLPF